MKTVARIKINRWDPLDVVIAGEENQRIQVGQAVEVELPAFIVKGKELPPHIVTLEVRNKADETALLTVIGMVYDALPEYRRFWNDRKIDYELGSVMILGLDK